MLTWHLSRFAAKEKVNEEFAKNYDRFGQRKGLSRIKTVLCRSMASKLLDMEAMNLAMSHMTRNEARLSWKRTLCSSASCPLESNHPKIGS